MGRRKQFDDGQALEMALNVFWQKGYEGTSLDDLTKATGVARPGLYAAFGNKEELFRKSFDLYEEKYLGFMTQALQEPTSRQVAEHILRGSLDLHTQDPEHRGCLGLNGALACSDDAQAIQRRLVRQRKGIQLGLRRRLERAQKERDLPSSADCATLASFVMTVTQGMAVQAKAGASKKALEKLVDLVVDMWPSPIEKNDSKQDA